MLKHLEPVRFPPLLMDVCVGKGKSFEAVCFQVCPKFVFPQGPLKPLRCIYMTSESIKCMWIHWAFSGLSYAYILLHPEMFVSNSTKTSGYLSWATGPPLHFWKFTSAASLGINTTPKSWALSQLRSLQTKFFMTCFLLAEPPYQPRWDRVRWNVSSTKLECHRFLFFLLPVQQHNTFKSFLQLAFGQSPEYWNGCFRKVTQK